MFSCVFIAQASYCTCFLVFSNRWLVGWLAGWLVVLPGWLSGLAGLLAGSEDRKGSVRWAGWMAGWLAGLARWLAGWLARSGIALHVFSRVFVAQASYYTCFLVFS